MSCVTKADLLTIYEFQEYLAEDYHWRYEQIATHNYHVICTALGFILGMQLLMLLGCLLQELRNVRMEHEATLKPHAEQARIIHEKTLMESVAAAIREEERRKIAEVKAQRDREHQENIEHRKSMDQAYREYWSAAGKPTATNDNTAGRSSALATNELLNVNGAPAAKRVTVQTEPFRNPDSKRVNTIHAN